jgi:hypothetical protein
MANAVTILPVKWHGNSQPERITRAQEVPMDGPKKIIELDGVDRQFWRIEEGALHLWQGKLWSKEPVGCVKCFDKEGSEYATLCRKDDDGKEHIHCMQHGELEVIPY